MGTESSFYGDTPNYATDYPTQNDSNTEPVNGNSPAPSSFYPDGGAYQEADPVAAANYASQAAASAAAAAASDADAQTQAATATTQAANASSSATAAAGSASVAATGASAASSSATAAATSATNAGNSATAAAGSATSASTSATNAGNSATAASGSASAASTSAGNASTSATNAANSATAAATSAANAASAVQAAAGTATPLPDGTATVGTGTKWAREDHVHPGAATTLFTQLSLTAGSLIGDYTSNGSAGIDGTVSKVASGCVTKTAANDMFYGVHFSTPTKIFKVRVAGSNDQGYLNGVNGNLNIKLMAKQGSAPTSATDGTPLHSIGFYDTGNESGERELISFDHDTAWDYVWVYVWPQDNTGINIYVAQFEVFQANNYVNLNPVPGPNYFDNPALQFWPRGTSFSSFPTGNGVYTAARWVAASSDSSGNLTVSQVAGAPGTNSRAVKLQRTPGSTRASHSAINFLQRMSTDKIVSLRGKVVTISFDYKVGADFSYSTGANLLSCSVYASAQTADAVPRGNGGALSDNPYYFFNGEVTAPTPGGPWKRFSFSFTVPNDVSSLDFRIRYYPGTAAAGADDSMYLGQFKLEQGYYATPFVIPDEATNRRAAETFYHNTYVDDTAPGLTTDSGLVTDIDTATSATGTRGSYYKFPQCMRSTPSTLTFWTRGGTSGKVQWNSYSAGVQEVAPTMLSTNRRGFGMWLNGVISGLTAGYPVSKFYHYEADAEIYGT